MKLASFSLGFFLCIAAATAQELDVNVSIKFEMLTPGQRDYLENFENELKIYLNDYNWTDVDFRGDKIPVTMEIFFTSASDAGDFSAQVVIVSFRRIFEDDRPSNRSSVLLRVNDQKWSFNYIKGTPLYHNDFQFNPLTSFLDFYANIIVGLDFDSFEELQGAPYYQKAMTILQRAQATSYGGDWLGDAGKYSRGNFLSELTNAQFETIRKSLFLYYYEGLDYLKSEQREAQQSIADALKGVSDVLIRTNVKSLLITMFLENKREEMCEVLEGFGGRAGVMRDLMQADPPRAEYYRRCSF